MKRNLLFVACSATIIIGSLFVLNTNNEDSFRKLKLNNLEALSVPESGASSRQVTCYNNYSTCWFWNCEKIWRCSTVECYEVKSDSKDEKDICYVN